MNAARRKEISAIIDLVEKIKDAFNTATGEIERVAGEERDYYDNMSENLQGGDKGTAASEAADELEEAHNALNELDLDDIISKLDNAKGEQ